MVYINYPRVDLDTHADLTTWRAGVPHAEGDWTDLKTFLNEQAHLQVNSDVIPKCWYSELPQGDNYALDVEHFRPKNSGAPLSPKHLKLLESHLGYTIFQENTTGAYSWLEFDYRNYRLVTATPNRAGAKHIYFPVTSGSARLTTPQVPWKTTEYNLLLDPANPHDGSLLLVKPNGIISPRAKHVRLDPSDFANYQALWKQDGFNYLRAAITIVLYRLNDKIFIDARERVYKKANEDATGLYDCLSSNISQRFLDKYIEDIVVSILPSAPFSLAARCGLKAYVPDPGSDPQITAKVEATIKTIFSQVDALIAAGKVSWKNP